MAITRPYRFFVVGFFSFKADIYQDKILGLGVIDIIRWGKSKNYDLERVKKLDPKEFIPSSTKRKYLAGVVGKCFVREKWF